MSIKWILGCLLCLIQFLSSTTPTEAQLIFCGDTTNDLYKVLIKNDFEVEKYNSPMDAIIAAQDGAAVFIVADGYPKDKNKIGQKLLQLARKKNLRLYIEYPASLPGLNILDTVIETRLERGIIVSDDFGKELPPMSIIGINDCHILPVKVDSPLIVLGRVAGFAKAVYGISDVKTYPVLFQQGNMLVAMTKLSNFATGRYEPSSSWENIWDYIISKMTQKQVHLKHWLSYVHPAYGKDEYLPDNAKKLSVKKGVQWFFNAHLLVDSSWEKLWLKYQGDGSYPVGPPVSRNAKVGNGKLGIIEGPTSKINYNGTQEYRYWVRADDQGETAYALSAAASFLNEPDYDKVADNLINFLLYNSNLRGDKKGDKNSPVFGLIGWAVTHPVTFYGDDNARCMLGLIGASAYLHTDKWDKEILENILANFRTTGNEGFRGDRLEAKDILKNGWQYYWNRDLVNPHPHFESWLWACYLWLYGQTGYKPLLTKTETAMRITMKDYPDKWKWTNGIQQERARMILPLAWLVRVSNTPAHRQWLDSMVTDLLSFQAPSGAIREELGAKGYGMGLHTKSNKDYGTHESSLIFENGDPVADMLYTCNFAFFSLNEAAHATGNKKWQQAVEKLSDFLTRIQVKSNKFKDVNGAWFRAFDYKLWDYWASNADAGWGAWSTLTGWIQSWIVSTQVLAERDQSYWNLTKNSNINDYMKQAIKITFKTK